jgi:hypothetical protein
VSKPLFVERLLVRPSGPLPPEPAAYDETRGYSVTADGRPFIETGTASVETVTITEARGEADDRDPDDDDLRCAATFLHTETKASGERPDLDAWAHTETRAPGEPPDYDVWASTFTQTFVQSEAVDEDED